MFRIVRNKTLKQTEDFNYEWGFQDGKELSRVEFIEILTELNKVNESKNTRLAKYEMTRTIIDAARGKFK